MKSRAPVHELLDKGDRLGKNYLQLDQELKALRVELLSTKMNWDRASRAGIPVLLDKGARLHEKVVECEQEFRVLRSELLASGRADLAPAFLVTPIHLRDLAGFFFRGEPLVSFSTKAVPIAVSRDFPAKFTLEHREGEAGLLWRSEGGQVRRATETRLNERFWEQITELLSKGLMAKLRLNRRERFNATQQDTRPENRPDRKPDIAAEMREFVVQMARAYPLEEWLGFFADAIFCWPNRVRKRYRRSPL
jgi:hypothetical protein